MNDPHHLKITKQIQRPGILFSIAHQPATTRVFTGASDFKVHDFDVMVDNPEPVEYVGHESYVTGVVLAGKYLVSGGYDGRLIWWNTETGEQVRAIQAHDKWIRAVQATPDGRFVVSVADDMLGRVWDIENGTHLRDLSGHALRTPHHFPARLCSSSSGKPGFRNLKRSFFVPITLYRKSFATAVYNAIPVRCPRALVETRTECSESL